MTKKVGINIGTNSLGIIVRYTEMSHGEPITYRTVHPLRSYILLYMCLIFSALLFGSCKQDYVRQEGCHLDQMNLHGNVVKVETIVQSSMPLTELYFNSFNPQNTISFYAGNFSILFDNHGYVEKSIGYDINGKQLFDVKFCSKEDSNITPFVPIGPGAKQNIDKIKTVSSENGNVVEVQYFDGNKLIWKQRAFYNEDGTINSITKEYESLRIKNNLLNIEYSDTTLFSYLSYDEYNNWTEVLVEYKGILPKHTHSYKIKRQITYATDGDKPQLIQELQAYNNANFESTDAFDIIPLRYYGAMKIPHYMAIQSQNYINDINGYLSPNLQSKLNYVFMSVYDNNDAYATISVSITPSDGGSDFDNLSPRELAYDEETDKYFEEENTRIMAQGGAYILKWLPYSFVKISGHNALKICYYRYGNGSPIPVYCENYTIPMNDGNTLCIIYSFQSNLDYRFRMDFDKAINSINLNR